MSDSDADVIDLFPPALPAEPVATITEHGIYDLPEHVYHRDPWHEGSLSCSEARLILEAPAKYRWRKDHGQEHRDVWDFGKAAHALVLGVGAPVVIIDADDWRTKDAKTQRDKARASGHTPVLAKDWAEVEAMAAAIRAHPLASRLLNPDRGGQPEQSLFWLDRWSGVTLRALIDWLPPAPDKGRMIVVDYKTTANAERDAFSRSVADYGYHLQADWYLDGVRTLLGVSDPAFLFVAQEKTAPYVVNVIELHESAMSIARDWTRKAIDTFVRCRTEDRWPGYSDDVELVTLPRYAEIRHEEEFHDR